MNISLIAQRIVEVDNPRWFSPLSNMVQSVTCPKVSGKRRICVIDLKVIELDDESLENLA